MTQESRFWTGISTGDAGPYSFENMNEIFRYMMGSVGTDSGVFYASGSGGYAGLAVTESNPAATSVTVHSGAALVHGSFYKSSVDEVLAIAANTSGNPRLDLVVLTKLWSTQTVRLEVLQGTPAVSPALPAFTLTDGFKWQFPLAYISVANGFATIVNANIVDMAPKVQPAYATIAVSGAAYAATLNTFVDMNASVNLSLVIQSTKVKVTLVSMANLTGGAQSSVAIRNDELATDFLQDYGFQLAAFTPTTVIGVITGLTPGIQVFRPRMRNVTGAGTATFDRVIFTVEEIRE